MSDFFFFLKNSMSKKSLKSNNNATGLQLELAKKTNDILTGLVLGNKGIEKKDITTFSNEFSGLVSSEKFIQDLSNMIKSPNRNESEDEFIKHCKLSLSTLIDKYIDGKSK